MKDDDGRVAVHRSEISTVQRLICKKVSVHGAEILLSRAQTLSSALHSKAGINLCDVYSR